MQQDNNSKHTSHSTKEWLKKNKGNVLDWLSQSPDLNLIKILWKNRRTEFETVPNLWRKTAWDRFMRTASNSPLTQKYGDKTTHVSITISFVLKLIGSPVLTQLRTDPKKCRFSIPIGKNHVPRGPPWTAGPHAIAWVAWCLNTLPSILWALGACLNK